MSTESGGVVMEERRIAVITGATSGIGLSAAKMLTQLDIRVIAVGRDTQRCDAAKAAILAAYSKAQIEYVIGDLSTTMQVRLIAAQIRSLLSADHDRLDILMNVAGTVSSWYVNTAEAYELQFAVNHLAPFLLTHELLPCLLKAPSARILVVSSESHYHTRIRWDDIMLRKHYHILKAYKQSKLCNVLFTTELARRLAGTAVSTYAIDPGLANTDIGLKSTAGVSRWVWKLRQRAGTSPDVPAHYMVSIATDPRYQGQSGFYWRNGCKKTASPVARDPEQAARLWTLSKKLCAITDYLPKERSDMDEDT